MQARRCLKYRPQICVVIYVEIISTEIYVISLLDALEEITHSRVTITVHTQVSET